MTAFEQVLARIRAVAKDEADKGERFEVMVAHALRTDRTFQQQFTDVWLWMNWPDRTSADVGVDIVARNVDGTFTAIQCKCYDPITTLTKQDIDSFLATSGKVQFARRIVVATTDLWSSNAERALEGHAVPVERMGVDDLDAMTVDWSSYDIDNPDGLAETPRHELRPHQVRALEDVLEGFKLSDRGKLIMACGTGKTFTALRIAEQQVGAGKSVLLLAPSIALVSQSLKEWTGQCEVPIRPFAVCSDPTTGKPIAGENAMPYDLAVPPTTEAEDLVAAGVADLPDDAMTVVFSTYQSIEVIAVMQQATGLRFDMVVCDEAHRTAGVTTEKGEERVFTLVHDDEVVPARQRLYMTATPKLFKPLAADAAREADAVLASMDDPEFYGEEFHRLGFGEAVEQGLLADYRVLILAVDEQAVSEQFQHLLSTNGELSLPDVAKFVGCLSGLAKLPGAGGEGFVGDETPMQRAVAFWSRIAESERFAEQFEQVADFYFDQLGAGPDADLVTSLAVPTRHVDGTTRITSRRTDIRWLTGNPPDGECRVLTNAQCLTEGVDVPALDAVMFLTSRRSKIDIVQAVGRVMRKPPGKQIGYVILPVAVTAGIDPSAALAKNPDYDAVWEVLQALRAHDERFNAYINQIALGSRAGEDDKIKVIPVDVEGTDDTATTFTDRLFEYEAWTNAIYARIVEKVGTRTYWEDWARDVAQIAANHEIRITAILDRSPEAAEVFGEFLSELHSTLNDSITRAEAVSMVSQHLITRPIFSALFGDDDFTASNPVSQAMSRIVAVLDEYELESGTAQLGDFYASIRRRVEGIHPDDGHARQTVIKDLYGRFFKIAFPKVADKLGIVYTPVEVVDFIIRAVEAALVEHFDGASVSDEGVHVLDPFTGTGTFVTRLLQSGFIRPDDMDRKFGAELHANEILLLAYYIAAVNIETTYRQERSKGLGSDPGYEPFPGIVLTDTFQLGEAGEGTGTWDVFPINNERATRQRGLDIRVVFGNPPYSVGQESANDANANLKYSVLDASIADSYITRSSAKQLRGLYDSYVRAIRWASDRLLAKSRGGVVAFVTNGGYIDNPSFDGFRLAVAHEFHHIYVFNLRGNARTSGELRRKEAGNVFKQGSRATVAIILLVKEEGDVPDSGALVHYRDIGDYLTREEKLEVLTEELAVREVRSPVLADADWTDVVPNEHGDWINQRTESFAAHLAVHADDGPAVFASRTFGLFTSRDAWNYAYSREHLDAKVDRMVSYYNGLVDRFAEAHLSPDGTMKMRAADAREFVKGDHGLDPSKFSWDRGNFADMARGRRYGSADRLPMIATYRPFNRRWVEAGRPLNSTVYQLPRVFPSGNAENMAIGVSTVGSRSEFSTFVVRDLPDLHLWVDDTPCLPRYVYNEPTSKGDDADPEMFAEGGPGRRHNVTDHALERYRSLGASIDKDDIFFYVYGILHSPDYRSAFASDLKRSLPRIPQVGSAEDFWAFSKAGRELAHLHTEYEEVEPWPDLEYKYAATFDAQHPDANRVLKMKHPMVTDREGNRTDDRTRIVYNDWITISGIPNRAYDYQLGSRSAIAWVMESWRVRTDKKSGIVNDPNDWATEHDDPTYILDLVGRVVTVSMRTLDIIESLPPLDLMTGARVTGPG